MLKVRNQSDSASYIYIYIYRCALTFFLLLLLPVILGTFVTSNTFAHDITTNVQVKPSLKITLPSSSLSEYLDPSITPFGSESITVTVATNNENGYKLYLNSNNTTRLVNTVDNTKYIDTLTSSATGTEEAFPVNSWGYRISNGNTGDSTITSTTNYFPFVSGKVISSSPIATNGVSSTLDFATKIDYEKPAGQYNIALNFKALPIVTQKYMQEITTEDCTEDPTIVIDKRDEQTYTIRRINGTCWMIDNLKFIGTSLSSSTSNIANTYTDANPYLVNNGNGYTDLTVGNDYSDARIHVGLVNEDSIQTVWYNYAAASAGTITGINNTSLQEYDICPSGWKLPNTTEADTISTIDYNEKFNPITGGTYTSGEKSFLSYGHWWTSVSAEDERTRYAIVGDLASFRLGYYKRENGMYIRCVLKES